MADRVRSAFPSARVLIVVREQVSWLESFYKMEVALNRGVEKPRGLFGGAGPLDGYSRFDLSFLRYDKLVRYYQGLFGSERVLILPFENIQKSPTGFAKSVLEFAGLQVPDGFEAGSATINKGMELGSVAGQRLLNRTGLGNRLMPQVVARLLGSVLMRSSLSTDEAPLVFRRIAGDRFKQSNLELQRLVSFDLKALGYAL